MSERSTEYRRPLEDRGDGDGHAQAVVHLIHIYDLNWFGESETSDHAID